MKPSGNMEGVGAYTPRGNSAMVPEYNFYVDLDEVATSMFCKTGIYKETDKMQLLRITKLLSLKGSLNYYQFIHLCLLHLVYDEQILLELHPLCGNTELN